MTRLSDTGIFGPFQGIRTRYMPGFQEAVGRVIGRGNFFENSGCTGPDLGEERGGAREVISFCPGISLFKSLMMKC